MSPWLQYEHVVSVFFSVHTHANICQEHPGQKVRGAEILMFINDLLCTELLMQKVLQRVDERLTVKCMNAKKFLGARGRGRNRTQYFKIKPS